MLLVEGPEIVTNKSLTSVMLDKSFFKSFTPIYVKPTKLFDWDIVPKVCLSVDYIYY